MTGHIMDLLCGFLWAQFNHRHKTQLNWRVSAATSHHEQFVSLQIKQMPTKERACSDSTVSEWVLAMDAFSSIYLELKQSILVAQGQERKSRLV